MCSKIGNVSEGSPNVVDLIRAGKVDLIVNTPRSKQGRRDGYEIRRIQAAVAAGDAITVAAGKDELGVESIRELCYP